MRNSKLYECGGDGFDVSGSLALLIDNQFKNSVDKNISDGENSLLHLQANIIDSADMGIAIKDSSRAYFDKDRISSNRLSVSVFSKKMYFSDPEPVNIDGVVSSGNNQDIQVNGLSWQER